MRRQGLAVVPVALLLLAITGCRAPRRGALWVGGAPRATALAGPAPAAPAPPIDVVPAPRSCAFDVGLADGEAMALLHRMARFLGVPVQVVPCPMPERTSLATVDGTAPGAPPYDDPGARVWLLGIGGAGDVRVVVTADEAGDGEGVAGLLALYLEHHGHPCPRVPTRRLVLGRSYARILRAVEDMLRQGGGAVQWGLAASARLFHVAPAPGDGAVGAISIVVHETPGDATLQLVVHGTPEGLGQGLAALDRIEAELRGRP